MKFMHLSDQFLPPACASCAMTVESVGSLPSRDCLAVHSVSRNKSWGRLSLLRPTCGLGKRHEERLKFKRKGGPTSSDRSRTRMLQSEERRGYAPHRRIGVSPVPRNLSKGHRDPFSCRVWNDLVVRQRSATAARRLARLRKAIRRGHQVTPIVAFEYASNKRETMKNETHACDIGTNDQHVTGGQTLNKQYSPIPCGCTSRRASTTAHRSACSERPPPSR